MDSAKVTRFLAASFLLLTLLGDPTAACTCFPQHLQNAYCSSTIVIKAKFVGVTEGENDAYKLYEIVTTKVYKAPKVMEDIHFLYSMPTCQYHHNGPFNGEEEYLITGWLNFSHFSISMCDIIKPWAELTAAQKRGLDSDYAAGCGCDVKPCGYYYDCTTLSSNDCPWTDRRGSQAQDMACLPTKGSSSACSWQTLNS